MAFSGRGNSVALSVVYFREHVNEIHTAGLPLRLKPDRARKLGECWLSGFAESALNKKN